MEKNIKEHIQEEAIHMFYNYGIKAMTMDELASRMGISKRTIYEHFKDKDELLSEAISAHKCKADEGWDEVLAKSENILDLISMYLEGSYESQINTNRRFTEELKKYHPKVYHNILLKHEEEGHRNIAKVIHLGIEQGVFQENTDSEVLITFLKRGIIGVMDEPKLKRKYSSSQIIQNCASTFFRGISTPKGISIIDKKLAKKTRKTKSKNTK